MMERKILYQNEFIREENDNEYNYIFVNNELIWKNKIGTPKFYCNDFDNHESGIVKPAFIGEFRMYNRYGNMYAYGNVIDEFNWEKFEIDTEKKITGYSYQKGREVFDKDSNYDITTKYLLDEQDNIIEENKIYTSLKINKKNKNIIEKNEYNYTYIMNTITKKPIKIIDNIKNIVVKENEIKCIDNIFNNICMNSEMYGYQ
jgi:hypothetical protein